MPAEECEKVQVHMGSLLGSILPVGRTEYRLVIENGSLLEMTRIELAGSKNESPYVSMPEAARLFQHGRKGKTRNWAQSEQFVLAPA